MNLTLRERIKDIPVLGHLGEWAWRRLTGRRDLAFTLLNSSLLRPDAVVLKIGANDGAAGDPISRLLISRPAMRCVFVEPVPRLLARARELWGDSRRFSYVCAAINNGRPATFYYIDPQALTALPDLEIDTDQIGSFDRNHILKHPGGEKLGPYIRTLDVSGMSLDTLLRETLIESLDLLHIDTEGWDWKILSQLELARWAPAFILFEHINLQESEKNEARHRLSPLYQIDTFGTDWLCTRKSTVVRAEPNPD